MTYLVTGAQGCIGSWIVKNLIESGQQVVVFDLDTRPHRLEQILPREKIDAVTFAQGDICDLSLLRRAMDSYAVNRIIHLAALQMPACQSDPPRGGLVNVVGTLNVFQAAVEHGVQRVVYASSAGVAGSPDDYEDLVFTASSGLRPHTHYGVFKHCNEENARVYFESGGLSGVGLRPWAVYGVGRDVGLTSDPTKAIKSAVLGRAYEIQFGGRANMQYVDDVARIFVRCAEAGRTGARVFNLTGEVLSVSDMVAAIERVLPGARGLIGHRENQLPIMPEFDDAELQAEIGMLPRTSFVEGVRQTAAIFENLLAGNKLHMHDLASVRDSRATGQR